MNFGEHLKSDEIGTVSGAESGRFVAKFANINEAELFCKAANLAYEEH